ncbi:30S ribosomal protein S8 [Candidatus Peregrinibacteria bacterium]|nr:30S ribosomal protein S8 [Candidatus Peregrinibacteria bacterium]
MAKVITDPIADLLTRIRNAMKARHDVTNMPYSKIKSEILKVMKERGFIEGYEKVKNGKFNELQVVLKETKYLTFKRMSKPGQRIYVQVREIKKVNGGMGVAILSTPKGVMSADDAMKQKLGGELLCQIY